MYFLILLIGSQLSLCIGQFQNKPSVQFLFSEQDDPTPLQGLTINQNKANFPPLYKNSKKMCVKGMWAMYSKPNFGMNDIQSTWVTPMSGRCEIDCTDIPISSYLENCESIRAIGVGTMNDMNFQQVESYKNKYFLFETPDEITRTNPGSKVPNPETIKSFAVTGRTGQWIVCNDTTKTPENCCCLDLANGMFMVPDCSVWPSEKPLYKISSFEDVIFSSQPCYNFYRPMGICIGDTSSS